MGYSSGEKRQESVRLFVLFNTLHCSFGLRYHLRATAKRPSLYVFFCSPDQIAQVCYSMCKVSKKWAWVTPPLFLSVEWLVFLYVKKGSDKDFSLFVGFILFPPSLPPFLPPPDTSSYPLLSLLVAVHCHSHSLSFASSRQHSFLTSFIHHLSSSHCS